MQETAVPVEAVVTSPEFESFAEGFKKSDLPLAPEELLRLLSRLQHQRSGGAGPLPGTPSTAAVPLPRRALRFHGRVPGGR